MRRSAAIDKEGFVYSLAHEDDVKILRWKEKYDSIPDDTRSWPAQGEARLKETADPPRHGTVLTEAAVREAAPSAARQIVLKGPLPGDCSAIFDGVTRCRCVRTVAQRLLDAPRIEAGFAPARTTRARSPTVSLDAGTDPPPKPAADPGQPPYRPSTMPPNEPCRGSECTLLPSAASIRFTAPIWWSSLRPLTATRRFSARKRARNPASVLALLRVPEIDELPAPLATIKLTLSY